MISIPRLQPKTEAQQESIKKRLLKQEAAKRKQLEKLGIDYDFSGYAQKQVDQTETPVKKDSAAPKKASSAKKAKTGTAKGEVRARSRGIDSSAVTLTGCVLLISRQRRRLASRCKNLKRSALWLSCNVSHFSWCILWVSTRLNVPLFHETNCAAARSSHTFREMGRTMFDFIARAFARSFVLQTQ